MHLIELIFSWLKIFVVFSILGIILVNCNSSEPIPKKNQSLVGYIIQLDSTYFQDIDAERKLFLQEHSTRVAQTEAADRYKPIATKSVLTFAQQELNIPRERITHVYVALFLGFAVEISEQESKAFLRKIKTNKVVTNWYLDEPISIN